MKQRIDVWLKFVCLFKHRNEAAEACRGGHVKINGLRAKPAATVHEKDVVEFLQGTHYRRVVVTRLPEKQMAKDEAKATYVDETPKQEIDVTRIALRERGSGRPTKRERRELDKIRR